MATLLNGYHIVTQGTKLLDHLMGKVLVGI